MPLFYMEVVDSMSVVFAFCNVFGCRLLKQLDDHVSPAGTLDAGGGRELEAEAEGSLKQIFR